MGHLLAKYNPEGELTWVQSAGGVGFDQPRNLKIDSNDNISLTGYFYYSAEFGSILVNSSGECDIFLAKYDTEGTLLWVRSAGGSQFDQGWGICCDEFDNNYLIGFFENTASFGSSQLQSNGGWDIFIARYDSDGTLIWIQKAGSSENDQGRDIVLDNNGDFIITGFFCINVNFDEFVLTNAGEEDIFIAELDCDGQFNWARTTGGSDSELANSLASDNDNNTLLTGKFNEFTVFDSDSFFTTGSGDNDIFFAKLDTGNINKIEQEYLDYQKNVMAANYPNPFSSNTTISFSITAECTGNAEIEIYNIKGQKVKELRITNNESGVNEVLWDGTDETDKPVESGIFFYRLQAGNVQKMKKMILLR